VAKKMAARVILTLIEGNLSGRDFVFPEPTKHKKAPSQWVQRGDCRGGGVGDEEL
jgi:hypothetical protein